MPRGCVDIDQMYIVGQVHSPEVGRMLNDILDKTKINSSSLLQALETILGDSNPQFLQSLRVPDWTLLFFKLQSRILDQEKLGKRYLAFPS